jgi:hypothetical protein
MNDHIQLAPEIFRYKLCQLLLQAQRPSGLGKYTNPMTREEVAAAVEQQLRNMGFQARVLNGA